MVIQELLQKPNVRINIIGDSIAAGAGSTGAYKTEQLIKEDDIVFVLMGLNDRKRKDGMTELKENSERILDELISRGKMVVVLTPNPSVHSNEYYENRLYHTDKVVEVLRKVAKNRCVQLIDLYQYILNYLKDHNQKMEDIIFNPDGIGDGLHPGDFVQRLMFEKIMEELGKN